MTRAVVALPEKQIPFGNDNQKGEGRDRSGFPSGMTTKKATAETEADSLRGIDNQKGEGKDRSRFPSGMTTKKARAKTEADSHRE
jgi:hypothetical protein